MHSRFGAKWLGIRVRHMFMYGALLVKGLTRLRPHSRFGAKWLGIRVRYMFMYSALLILVKGLTRLRMHSRFGAKWLGIRVRCMFMYSALSVKGLTRLRPHSRFGAKWLGIRVRYMFMYSALLKEYSYPLIRLQSSFGDKFLRTKSEICRYMYSAVSGRINPFKTAVPFWGQMTWNY